MISLRSYCVMVVALFAVWKTTTAVAMLQVNCTSLGMECAAIANATCNVTVGKCQCVAGYEKASNNQNTCAKIVPTTTCKDGSACTGQPNSVCSSGTCKCSAGFVMTGNACIKDPATNCTEGSPCTGQANSLCRGGKCICKAGFLIKANTCTKAVNGTKCTASGKECDVIDHAECDGTNCKCRSGYTMKVNVCAAENAATRMELGHVALPLSIFMLTLLKKLF